MRPVLALIVGTVALVTPATVAQDQPNILVVWGDDIGQSNISAYTRGLVGYRTPNINRLADEGMIFTDYYGEQSCTAGRASFIMGQSVFRTGLSKVGLPGAALGIGLCLTLIHLISIPVTNTSVNPARSTSVAVFAGGRAINQLWLFWVAPIVGAALGAIAYPLIGGAKERSLSA